jgi:hypothetical protein
MPPHVCSGATLQCSHGTAPGTMNVTPRAMVNAAAPPATIMDNKPDVNIMPFGLCTTLSNPAVLAARGVPQPCVPVITAPWSPGCPAVCIGNNPVVHTGSRLTCVYGGIIRVKDPGQTGVNVNGEDVNEHLTYPPSCVIALCTLLLFRLYCDVFTSGKGNKR